jgi:hypothetical protein
MNLTFVVRARSVDPNKAHFGAATPIVVFGDVIAAAAAAVVVLVLQRNCIKFVHCCCTHINGTSLHTWKFHTRADHHDPHVTKAQILHVLNVSGTRADSPSSQIFVALLQR